MLLPSCAPLGIYSKGHLNRETSHARNRGFAEGRAMEIRRIEWERQQELSRPQPTIEPYEMNVPAHTATDGVNIVNHKRIVEFATQ